MDIFYNFNEYNVVEDKEGKYGGTCVKYILEDSKNSWMIKLPAKVPEKRYLISYRNSSESEYIGCKIFKSVMINAQDVFRFNKSSRQRKGGCWLLRLL